MDKSGGQGENNMENGNDAGGPGCYGPLTTTRNRLPPLRFPEHQDRRSGCRRPRTSGLLAILALLLLGTAIAFGSLLWNCSARCLCPRACPDGWIGYRGKCYYFSESEKNWTAGKDDCSDFRASLAVVDSRQDLVFLLLHKSHFDSWIGLRREYSGSWKWANGTEFNNLFPIKGDEKCAYLKGREVSTSRCYTERTWICTMP